MPAVITAAGAVSAFGVGLSALLGGLAEARCGIGPLTCFDASTFPVRVGGEVTGLSTAFAADRLAALLPGQTDEAVARLSAWSTSGLLRDRKVLFAALAAVEAWSGAGLGAAERDAWLVPAFGLEHAFLEDAVLARRVGRIDWDAETPGLPEVRFRSQVDHGARCIAELLGLRGPIVPHVSACAGGGLALAHAAALIERGAAARVLCGAADSMLNPLGLGGMIRLGAPSPRNAADACRPFDRRRDGLVIGEGAAMFVVEDEASARARGARPLARILGWGSTQDGYRVTAPRPDGVMAGRAMSAALARADLSPEAVDYINAHGTGTPLNDPVEVRAIRAALGTHAERVPVSSIKGAVGHLMAASGAIEAAACLLVFLRDLVPGTQHYREPDPECDLPILGETPRPGAHVAVVLSNSFGFGGQNVALLLGRPS